MPATDLRRYNTYIAHYKELECMRIALEPLLYKYGVDIIFAGYVSTSTPTLVNLLKYAILGILPYSCIFPGL